MRFWNISAIAIALALPTTVNAASIVDTGIIACDDNRCSGATFSSVLNPDDKWSARFSLNSNTTITDMNVWINAFWNINTTFTMALYADNITSPDITNELFSQDVLVTDKAFEDSMNSQWQGLTDINLNLDAGNYWLSLELRDGNDYDGYIPTGEFGALNAVDIYAFYNPSNGVWAEDPTSDFAFQIAGDVSAVPVPAALWLFGSGLIGLVGLARRKKA